MTPASPPGRRRSLSIAEVLCLFAIVAVGLGVRALYLQAARQTPGYVWEDPDGYMGQALKLADPVRGWTWTFDAVTYDIEGRRHALPPGYSVFLSVFALFPGFPLTAQIAQVLLSAVSICLVFALGRLDPHLGHGPARGRGLRAVGSDHLQRVVDVAGNRLSPADAAGLLPAGTGDRR